MELPLTKNGTSIREYEATVQEPDFTTNTATKANERGKLKQI